ncbi:hypothetical protein [Streptomonospora alba]|nr:hypothetical protein [Streptomonospora alba]
MVYPARTVPGSASSTRTPTAAAADQEPMVLPVAIGSGAGLAGAQ